MNGKLRFWAPATGLAALVIVAGGYFLGVQPALAAASTDQAAAAAAVTQRALVETKLTRLASIAAHQDELDAQQTLLKKAVPSSLKANTFVRRMNDLAALDGVVITAVVPGTGASYTPTAVAAAASSQTSGGSVVYGATDPSITPKNFVEIPMAVTATGPRSALLAFTKDAQTDERLFIVSTYTLAPASDAAAGWSTTLTGLVFAVKR